jgi:hypothetical protein
MNAWGLEIDGGVLALALPRRKDVQDWAGQRFVGSATYDAFKHDPPGLWKQIQRGHPSARLVRVRVTSQDPTGDDRAT